MLPGDVRDWISGFLYTKHVQSYGQLLSVHHIKWKRLSEMHKYIFLDQEVIIMSCALAGTFSIVQHLVHYCISRCLVVWYKSLKWIKWYISQTIIKNIVYAPTAATTQSSAEPFSLLSPPSQPTCIWGSQCTGNYYIGRLIHVLMIHHYCPFQAPSW